MCELHNRFLNNSWWPLLLLCDTEPYVLNLAICHGDFIKLSKETMVGLTISSIRINNISIFLNIDNSHEKFQSCSQCFFPCSLIYFPLCCYYSALWIFERHRGIFKYVIQKCKIVAVIMDFLLFQNCKAIIIFLNIFSFNFRCPF